VRPAASRVYIAADGEVAHASAFSFPFAGAVHGRTGQNTKEDARESASGLTATANGERRAGAHDKPATLFDVMQATIGQGLQAHYQAPREMTHQLLVLLMQLNEERRTARQPAPGGRDRIAAARSGRDRRGVRPDSGTIDG
jgi:hypothetical protein